MSLFKGTKSHGLYLANNAPFHLEIRATDPVIDVDSEVGRIWYNSAEKTLKYTKYNEDGSAVIIVGVDSKTAHDLQVFITDLLSKENGKGSDLVGVKDLTSTNGEVVIPNGTLTEVLKAIIDNISTKLDKVAGGTVTGDVTFNGKVSLTTTPVADSDATTKSYVDLKVQNATAGIDAKESVVVATTDNIDLTTVTQIDGITLKKKDRVLVKNQTDKKQNGIYELTDTGLARTLDAVQDVLTSAAFVFVTSGVKNGQTGWKLATLDAIVIGTTELTWSQFSSSEMYSAGVGLALSGSEFSVSIPASEKRLEVDVTGLHLSKSFVDELSQSGNDSSKIKQELTKVVVAQNSNFYSFTADTPQTSFIIQHNLNTKTVIPMVWVEDETGTFHKNDLVDITLNDGNKLTITLTEAKKIIVNVISLKPIPDPIY